MPLSTILLRGYIVGLFICLLPILGLQAQGVPSWRSVRSLGNSEYFQRPPHQVTDAAGNLYQASDFFMPLTIAGTRYAPQGGHDAYLAKFDAAGNLLWIRMFSTPGPNVTGSLVCDAAGNVYLHLYTTAITLGNGLTVGEGSHIIRYSPQGVPVWTREVESSSTIGIDGQNHVYVEGTFASTMTLGTFTINQPPGTGAIGLYLARLSATTGAVEGLNLIGYAPPAPSAPTYFGRMAVAPSGEVYVLYQFTQSIAIGSTTYTSRGSFDVLVARVSAQGTPLWSQQNGGPGYDAIGQAASDNGGNLYLCGDFAQTAGFGTLTATSAGAADGYLVKYTPLGTAQWVQTGGGTGADYWCGLHLDAQGNVNLAGKFHLTARYGPSTVSSIGLDDVAVASYSSAGQVRWVQRAGSYTFDGAYSIGSDAAGNILVYGWTRDDCFFGSFSLSATADSEYFVAALSATILNSRVPAPRELATYPNPAHDQLHLPALPAGSRVQLVDALGRVVREATVSAAAPVSVRGLTPGLYTLRATDARGQRYSGRVVVE